MPRSTGRIRAEDLDHEAVTSRTFAKTIQSDNFIEGVAGWRLQRDTGDFEANDGTFRGDLLVQGDTGITVSGGGDITVKSGGDVVINGGQVTILGSDGATEKAVLDQSGLTVDGGVVQAVWVTSDEDDTIDAALTTTPQTVGSVTVDPPDWVEQVTVFAFARTTIENPGSEILVNTLLTIDPGGVGEDEAGQNQDVLTNRWSNTMIVEEATFALDPAGRSFTVTQEASLAAGTFNNNTFSLKVFVFGVRSAFT